MRRALDATREAGEGGLGILGEREQDRLDDARVIEVRLRAVGRLCRLVEHLAADARPREERRHAQPVGRVGRAVAVRERRRCDMVEEAAVLVVGDDQQRGSLFSAASSRKELFPTIPASAASVTKLTWRRSKNAKLSRIGWSRRR